MEHKAQDMTEQEARDRKAKEMRLCRKYLGVAKSLGLSDESPTVRYWTQELDEWRWTDIEEIQEFTTYKGNINGQKA